jgi:hypothetical protein
VEDEEGEGQSGADPENSGVDGGAVLLCWRRRGAAARVERVKREQNQEVDVKANPMAERGGPVHGYLHVSLDAIARESRNARGRGCYRVFRTRV